MRPKNLMAGMTLICAGAIAATWGTAGVGPSPAGDDAEPKQDVASSDVDRRLTKVLRSLEFTGEVESTLEARLGGPINPALADLGRLLFFDNRLGLHEDNSCAGCHSPAFGFGDSQSIAIGVQNNGIVGPDRQGPRNQRKAPIVINSAFFPKLMLNGRFVANSGDPFNNSRGFKFPAPEGDALKFEANDPDYPTLLTVQAFIPSTELVEMAGFNGASTNPFFQSAPQLHQFDDGLGTRLPQDTNHTDFSDPGFLNEEIRALVLVKLNRIDEYVARFAEVFNGGNTAGFAITFPMIGAAIAEFECTLVFADAPIDRFARGKRDAMTQSQKRGALIFFGKAGCVKCHAVSGLSNEMFSDFENHVLGVPQIAPVFGLGSGNVVFDGDGRDEDFGAEQLTGNPADRYKFRTSPLRNVALQPAFFHDGAFTRLEDAIRHHLNVVQSARNYDAGIARIDPDLRLRMGPIDPLLDRLDPLVRKPTRLSRDEFLDLFAFVRDGLLDPRAKRLNTCGLVPTNVPSTLPVATFQGCQQR
jgi:cytochrome c peroxidase